MVVPLAAGNALRVFLEPPAGARLWRVLRKSADTFVGPDDPDAYVVHEGSDRVTLDANYLQNGTLYHYRAYYWDGAAWSASATATGTPNATYEDATTDVLELVRDRLAYGLQAEVARGALSPVDGQIRVFTAPPVYEDICWPVVTVQLQSETPAARALGEMVEPDEYDKIAGEWGGVEGWLARVQLAVTGWSQNPDERIELRKALRRIIVANLSVFDNAGMVQVEFQQQDMEDFRSYPAPVYQSLGTLTCLAPVRVVSARDPAITAVQSTIIEG